METKGLRTRGVSSVTVSCVPQSDSRDATYTDRWTSFLQLYESFIARGLTQQHPQFARALRQLERDTRLEQERQSAQVLATLRLKDTRISELQKLVSVQREQLDVVLDELERRETKENKEVQVGTETQKEDATVQTEWEINEVETQTEKCEEENGVLELLEKLEKELKTLEDKNLTLERQLQQRLMKSEEKDVKMESEEVKICLEILQQGVDAMELSCSCVDNPLTFFVGVSDENAPKEFTTMSTCVNLEHRLEAQAVRLEQVQDCLYLWRDAAVQPMKQQNEPNRAMAPPSISPSMIVRRDEKEVVGSVNCPKALRGALAQIRQHLYQHRGRSFEVNQHVLEDVAKVLAKGKSGAKVAAKMVQEWAKWEAKHLDEVRSLRQGFAEDRKVDLRRRIVLLKRVDHLEQRELDLQAEVNTLRKRFKVQEDNANQALTSLSALRKPGELVKPVVPLECDGFLEYPQLVLRLATAEQSLLAKDEQLTAANDTIRALSSCAPVSMDLVNCNSSVSRNGGAMDSINRLAGELQRVSTQKLDFFRRHEKDMISLDKYFQMQESYLLLQSRLEAEQKQVAMVKAANEVCERERDEVLMTVEKLETEALLANITRKPADPTTAEKVDEDSNAFFLGLTVKRLQLIESDRKVLRERLRRSQQQLALTKQRRPDCGRVKIAGENKLQTNVMDCIAEHHQKCVGEFKKFINQQGSTERAQTQGDNDSAVQSQLEWELFFSHYEALWIAFNLLYSSLGALLKTRENVSLNTDVLRAFGLEQASELVEYNSHGSKRLSQEALEFEMFKRDEKILLLQQRLTDQEETEWCTDLQYEDVYSPINSTGFDFCPNRGENHLANYQSVNNVADTKRVSEAGHPFLASTKLQQPQLESNTMSSSNGPGNETTPDEVLDIKTDTMATMEGPKVTATELEVCLAKCAYLASQNTKLTRRLRAEKETNKQYLKEQEELRTQLRARSASNSELPHTLEECRGPTPFTSSIDTTSPDNVVQSEENGGVDVKTVYKSTSPRHREYEREHDDLREQLASREQENLTLVQSLCSIKEKCAQMEATHQKELRVKAAEHAEGMESYMATVNETLSRIDNDKLRLEEENVKLRSSVQKLEEKSARIKLEQSQGNTKSTNTDSEAQSFDVPTYIQERESLMTRVQDLELQLSRERKLTEVVEQKKQLENQQEEQQESKAKAEVLKAKDEYETRCEALREWRNKLRQEFADYQEVQRTSQQENDRRIEFLSACIEEFARLTDATVATVGKTISTREIYNAVMALAREPQRTARREFTASKQVKQHVSSSPRSKRRGPNQQFTATSGDDSSSDILLNASKEQSESEKSEAMWWKLRASKMEAYVRSAMLQNDTFEDTIRQLELGMRNVKEELSSRLTRETQLVSMLATLKSELATAKEQAASIAEKYQQASAELEKRQGEATSHGNETQRARMAGNRKTELLTQQKAKVTSLQQELEQSTKKLERLATAEKQTAILQQKAKEHTQQLQHARQSYERCRDDNVQLSIHLDKMKERHADVVTRLKAARADNAHLRVQFSELKKSAKVETKETSIAGYNHRGNQGETNAVSVASLAEEARTLKRRVLQKQDVIVSYKAKVAEYEAQLERQRDTMVKLARTNRELQQGQRQRQQHDLEYSSAIHAKLESQLEVKQEQLDGLRASVYDSFEAFVYCRAAAPKSPSSSFVTPDEDPDKLFEIKRWTDFTVQDLEELKLARGPQISRHKDEREDGHNNIVNRKAARPALRDVEGALESNPEDCRAEICELLQCLYG